MLSLKNKQALNRFLLLSIMMLFGSLSAQVNLRVGSIINATLQPEQAIWYSVRTNERGILTVETVGKLDTVIGYCDKNLRLVKEDRGGINIFAVRGETYLFRLTGGSPEESGAFRIYAASSPMPDMTDLSIGDTKTANIREREENWYRFLAGQSGILTVETHGDTDTILQMFSENLVLLAEDDDGGNELNARLEFFVVQGKTYYFIITGHYDGEYQIAVTDIRELPDFIPLTLNAHGVVAPGKEDWYIIQTNKRDGAILPNSETIKMAGELMIIATTGNTNTMIHAYNEMFELIAFDDDSGDELNARVEFTISPNSTYYIKVVGWLDGGGEYGITVGRERY